MKKLCKPCEFIITTGLILSTCDTSEAAADTQNPRQKSRHFPQKPPKPMTPTRTFVQDESNAEDGGDKYANLIIDFIVYPLPF
ncbi:MAG: hypothetical protein J6K48_03680 [Lachnospiraceae bacterium]|nr:hypothetical protein [Lachnospiraceae bacterium]